MHPTALKNLLIRQDGGNVACENELASHMVSTSYSATPQEKKTYSLTIFRSPCIDNFTSKAAASKRGEMEHLSFKVCDRWRSNDSSEVSSKPRIHFRIPC